MHQRGTKSLPPRIAGPSEPADLDTPQYAFEIRAVSTSEQTIHALRPKAQHPPVVKKEHVPFEGWTPLKPDQTLMMHRADKHADRCLNESVIELTKRQSEHFIAAAQTDHRSNIRFAPKITVFEGQVGTISDGAEMLYIANPTADATPVGYNEAFEGTQISVRPTRLEDGRMQADVELVVYAIIDRHEIPKRDNGVFTREPQRSVSTISCSGILSGNIIHLAILPPEAQTETSKPDSPIKQASRAIGLGKPEPEIHPIVWIVSMSRVE